ncbi:polysaccharide pyruvyl transferase family protein [Intrasporangium sp.]|uniref:polysaccharide pyruvyl transferase family protein n=1 Tax=Intrasporangium sp. TaxID=1925024 RepID=UPI002B478448|nr:polysaccharide pyruvyl transferase family protein [Intrasporangium sp.]
MSAGQEPVRTKRVGLFGKLGAGNYGNDGSLEALLAHLRSHHPSVPVDCMAAGPTVVEERYGIPAVDLSWDRGGPRSGFRLLDRGLTALRVGMGLAIDAWRIACWTRQHSVAIVPGMGTFESTMQVRPWQTPWSLFALAMSARAFGTSLAVVSVGASNPPDPLTRILLGRALRLASHRSFRDEQSRAAASEMGVDTSHDVVLPDLAFALSTPPRSGRASGIVGVGVIAWYGAESERAGAGAINVRYRAALQDFLGRVVDSGRSVRLLVGDDIDVPVAMDMRDAVLAERPWLAADAIVFDPVSTLGEYMSQVVDLDAVVASRFHNVLCALMCGVPTIAVGYGDKHRMLMKRFGVSRFSHEIRSLDVDDLERSLDGLLAEGDRLSPQLLDLAAEQRQALVDRLSTVDDLISSARSRTMRPVAT